MLQLPGGIGLQVAIGLVALGSELSPGCQFGADLAHIVHCWRPVNRPAPCG